MGWRRESRLNRLQVFYKRIGHFRAVIVGDARRQPFYVLHQSIEIVARIRNADHANRGAVPHGTCFEFGDRNVKASAETVLQATNNLAFILQRLRRFDVKFDGEEGDQRQFLVSGF